MRTNYKIFRLKDFQKTKFQKSQLDPILVAQQSPVKPSSSLPQSIVDTAHANECRRIRRCRHCNAIPNLPGSRSAVHEACVRWIHRLPGCRSRFTAFRAKDVPFPPSCHRRKGSRHIASPLDLLADQSMVIATARRPRPYLCFRQTHLNTYPPSVYRFVSCVRKDVRI